MLSQRSQPAVQAGSSGFEYGDRMTYLDNLASVAMLFFVVGLISMIFLLEYVSM